MSRYIDAEKLYAEAVKWEQEALEKLTLYDATEKNFWKWSIILNERTSFKNDIMDAVPIENVVEMPVRCKDCIYCEQVTIPTSRTGMLFTCRRILMNVGEYGDGFCSWGVKYSPAEEKEVRNDVQIR